VRNEKKSGREMKRKLKHLAKREQKTKKMFIKVKKEAKKKENEANEIKEERCSQKKKDEADKADEDRCQHGVGSCQTGCNIVHDATTAVHDLRRRQGRGRQWISQQGGVGSANRPRRQQSMIAPSVIQLERTREGDRKDWQSCSKQAILSPTR
jgi:hypothetical protein